MKKYFPFVLVAAYISSLFLPYASGISAETYQLTTISGILFLKNHWLVTGILIALLLIYQWRGKQSLVVGNAVLVLIGLSLLYLYLIPFFGAFDESFTVGIQLIRDTLVTSLTIGYYLSGVFAWGGYFWLIKTHQT